MKSKIVFILFSVFVMTLFASDVIEESILAVIEDEIITSSEVEMALVIEGRLTEIGEADEDLIREKLLELIDERLILLAAIEESIQVEQSRADEFFDQRWKMLVDGYGGETALAEALRAEGYTIEVFKRKTRQQIKDFMLKQMYVERNFGRVDVVWEDVDTFYRAYRDSLPLAPAEVLLDGIVIEITPDSAMRRIALEKLDEASRRLDEGEEFSRVAAEISEDSSTAEQGGRLGTFSRGNLTPSLDSLAFSLGFDEIGGPVKSPMGYHLVKLLSRSGGQATIAHIVVKAPITPERLDQIAAMADSAYKIAKSRAVEFEDIPSHFNSPDEMVYSDGLGWIVFSALGKELAEIVRNSVEGATLGPFNSGEALEIYRVVGKREGRELTLDEDYELIEEFAKQYKTKILIDKHLEKLREKYYIEIRI